MIILGLTGSIGMGKSTTAAMFREAAIPVHDSDGAVHRIYASDAAQQIETLFPGVVKGGVVDRMDLAERVLDDPAALRRLEAIVHPLVRADAEAFIALHRQRGTRLIVLDIPLLFETDGLSRVDQVLVVTAPAQTQRGRVMARPGMTRDKFEAILARQVPDAEKRRRAEFVIDTSLGMDHAKREVARIIAELTGETPVDQQL